MGPSENLPDESSSETNPPEPVAGLPYEFLERLSRILADRDYTSAVESFTRPKRTAFRINTLRAETGSVLGELQACGVQAEAIPGLEGAFSVAVRDRPALTSCRPYVDHRIYLQNPSSMIPPLMLAPEPGEEILDLTAAPGSKTHQMACLMRNTGRITAVESVRSRYYRLRDNMNALGAEIVRPFFQDGTTTWRHRPEFFDRVLLDAPCSSEGRFRADDPETTRYWSRKKVREMSRKQRRLLFSAIHCLKPGGRLVYSTCSFGPEENEAVIHKLLQKFSTALRIERPQVSLPAFRPGLLEWDAREFAPPLEHAVRIVPDEIFDGFFVCRIEKVASTAAPSR